MCESQVPLKQWKNHLEVVDSSSAIFFSLQLHFLSVHRGKTQQCDHYHTVPCFHFYHMLQFAAEVKPTEAFYL